MCAPLQIAAERSSVRLKKQNDREEAERNKVVVKESLPGLKFNTAVPGRIQCGMPPEPNMVHAAAKPTQLEQKPARIEEKRRERRDSDKVLSGAAAPPEEELHEVVPSVDGQKGKWKRITAERYIDCYLNGGKYDPPSQSLMEEVDRQRFREGGYRNVSMFESNFIGKGRSPLGKPGLRFRARLDPLSVKQIEMYRKAGTRRPVDFGAY